MATEDRFSLYADTVIAQAGRWVTVTPDDNNDLVGLPKAVRLDIGGTIALLGLDGHGETFDVADDETLALPSVRVMQTDTTAVGIKALY